jgi:hypothetical protein
MELIDDDYPYASSTGMNSKDVVLNDTCRVQNNPEKWNADFDPTFESYDDIGD